MDCLILPSRLDSFGMVVVEAMAAGVPVIATSAAGAAQAIKPGVNGWIVEPGDARALVSAMRHVCAQIARVRAMRADCIASVEDHDWRRYRARAIEVIGSLAGSPEHTESRHVAA